MNYAKLDDLLKKDEDDAIEFKFSFKYDFKTKKPNKILQEEVVEAITGFLNANGGTVIIGVDNDNDNYIYGLDYDLKLYKDKSLDRFQQDLINKIDQFIGSEYYEFLKIGFPNKNDKTICMINVEPSNREVWFKDEYLYVRVGNTTRKLVGKKASDYIKMHWTESKEKQVEKILKLDELIYKYVINRRHDGFRTVYITPSLPNNLIPLTPDTGKFLIQNKPQYLRFGDYKIIQNGYQFRSRTSDSLAEITEKVQERIRDECDIFVLGYKLAVAYVLTDKKTITLNALAMKMEDIRLGRNIKRDYHVLAHEFAHVILNHKESTEKSEKEADELAKEWGFEP